MQSVGRGDGAANESSHSLWGFYSIHVDKKTLDAEVVPVRLASDHYNVLGWLENSPCQNCVKIAKISFTSDAKMLMDLKVKHPFATANLTGFDVRGIFMFDGGHTFAASGLTTPDASSGKGELLNADGYTTLYNGSTAGKGPAGLQGYFPGHLAGEIAPNAVLNGFKRYVSNKAGNTRNGFYSGDSVTETYEIALPSGAWVFGYGIDACWLPPTVKPVTDPMTQFPSSANCPEPWKIVVSADPIPANGQTVLSINIYDYSGKSSFKAPVIECQELFGGTVLASWKQDFAGYSHWVATIQNSKHAASGTYKCLISVEAKANDPSGKPWLNLTAYQIFPVVVCNGSLTWAVGAGGTDQDLGAGIAVLSDGSIAVTGRFQGSATFGISQPAQTMLNSDGSFDIFIATYNPDGTLVWARSAGGTGSDAGWAITSLPNDSVVVTGAFSSPITFDQGGGNELTLTGWSGGEFFHRAIQ